MPRLTLTKPEIEAIAFVLKRESDANEYNHPFQHIMGRHAKNSLLIKFQLLLKDTDRLAKKTTKDEGDSI